MDDDLLGQLGALEREDEASRPRAWEDVIAGTRTADEARALSEGIADADLDRYAALFRPMDDGETEALVDTLQAALARRDGDATADPGDLLEASTSGEDALDLPPPISLAQRRPPEEASPRDEDVSAGHPAAPLPLADARRSRRAWLTAAAGLVAFAAAFTLWLRPVDPPGPGGANTELSPFSLIVRNETVRFDRSAADDPTGARPRYRRDSTVHWLLSPDDALTQADSGALRVRAWASAEGSDAPPRSLPLGDALTISESGVVELRGDFGELFDLPPGLWTIQLAVAVGELPEGLADARRAARDARALFLAPHSLEVID